MYGSLSGDAGASSSSETTDEHPWWIVDGPDGVLSRWDRTDELAPGMVVVSRDPGGPDRYMTIDAAEETGRTEGTYNITVADFETYFVGNDRVLVHNCTGRKGASGTLTTRRGNEYNGNSTRFSRTGGAERAPMNGRVSDALDNVGNPSGTHGACCEIDAMNKAANAGEDLAGSRMGTVIDNKTGIPKEPCSSCRDVMDQLDVRYD